MLGPQGSVDLIILDIMMPGEDGLTFCQRLRETLDVPILMISAHSLSIDRSIGLELGADDYLPKPFERRELVARVKAILRRGGASKRESRAPRRWIARRHRPACGTRRSRYAVAAHLGRV